jgi:hypothetical protein
MRTLFLISLLTVTFISCKKEEVTTAAPSLIGTWKHYSAADAWHTIVIYDNGDGKMEYGVDGKASGFTEIRPWYMKENTLYFGKLTLNGELYEVIDYPVLSSTETIELFDTIYAGKKYMRLDKGIYVEI